MEVLLSEAALIDVLGDNGFVVCVGIEVGFKSCVVVLLGDDMLAAVGFPRIALIWKKIVSRLRYERGACML